ncbi:MAG: cytochrome c [Roseibium sp.]
MRQLLFGVAIALALAGAGFAGLYYWPIGTEANLTVTKGDAQRGAYLARMSGCIACHTDADGGGQPLAGGLKLPTDFGTFYSPNLTTDPENGIGEWTVEQFAKAVRQGVSPDGKAYYPSFPYPFYGRFSDQDVADLWAAFQTVPPVAEPSRPHEMVPPFNVRAGLKVWRALFLQSGPHEPDPEKSEEWNRGKFIVEGPAHCGACHTPRNFMGARQANYSLQGADKLPDGGKSPSITSVALKQGGWTIRSLQYALQTGIMPDGDVLGGSMGEVVRDGTAFLSDADRKAIAIYLLE